MAGGQKKFGRGQRTPSRKLYVTEHREAKNKKRNIARVARSIGRIPRAVRRQGLQWCAALCDVEHTHTENRKGQVL